MKKNKANSMDMEIVWSAFYLYISIQFNGVRLYVRVLTYAFKKFFTLLYLKYRKSIVIVKKFKLEIFVNLYNLEL